MTEEKDQVRPLGTSAVPVREGPETPNGVRARTGPPASLLYTEDSDPAGWRTTMLKASTRLARENGWA